ncbi:hypothetical protein V9T40_001384 [Parthenolecanium corni]|uniref:Cuticle protein n=1 Tax=Parthenolecanium corni TaxID=536013 RepID=A0AAN9TBF2_9HEMI
MFSKIVIALALVALVQGQQPVYEGNPNYSFEYHVADPTTGDTKSQSETRTGDAIQGSYSLVEPDGTTRTVDYTADDVQGFVAHVSKTGGTAPAANVAPKYVAPVAYHAPVYHAPVAPVYHAPVYHAPLAYHAPVAAYHAPVYHAPLAYHAPVYHAPVSYAAASYHPPSVRYYKK